MINSTLQRTLHRYLIGVNALPLSLASFFFFGHGVLVFVKSLSTVLVMHIKTF
eukprot:m.57628 g.57628  ORF g.57628 m.57628 type:complete len:53 (-) comp11612_c1_seq1:389-547(-)